MQPISDELIATIPKRIEASRSSAQAVVDGVVPVVFHLHVQVFTAPQGFPAPEWPYAGRADLGLTFLLDYLNGRAPEPGPASESWLKWFKRTATAYNRALDQGRDMEAEKIAADWQFYLDTCWDYCNQVARHVARCDGEQIYRTLTWPLPADAKI